MKKLCCCAFFALALLTSPGFRATAMSDAQVQVNIGLPLPPLIIPAPPPLLPIPGAYVYYPPDVDVDIFFHHDRWYRPHGGKWYRAKHHNGPWHIIHKRHVPRAVAGIPPSYRVGKHHYERVPYDKVQRHHRDWEKNRHWDRDDHRHGDRDNGRHGDRDNSHWNRDDNQKRSRSENQKNDNGRKDGHHKNDYHKADRHKQKDR